jgi:hypothetical protein
MLPKLKTRVSIDLSSPSFLLKHQSVPKMVRQQWNDCKTATSENFLHDGLIDIWWGFENRCKSILLDLLVRMLSKCFCLNEDHEPQFAYNDIRKHENYCIAPEIRKHENYCIAPERSWLIHIFEVSNCYISAPLVPCGTCCCFILNVHSTVMVATSV